jgi:hypothetical protein
VRPFPDVDFWPLADLEWGRVDSQYWSPLGGRALLSRRQRVGRDPRRLDGADVGLHYKLVPDFRPGKPTCLESSHGAGRGFAVGRDGRFLFNVPVSSLAIRSDGSRLSSCEWFRRAERRALRESNSFARILLKDGREHAPGNAAIDVAIGIDADAFGAA